MGKLLFFTNLNFNSLSDASEELLEIVLLSILILFALFVFFPPEFPIIGIFNEVRIWFCDDEIKKVTCAATNIVYDIDKVTRTIPMQNNGQNTSTIALLYGKWLVRFYSIKSQISTIFNKYKVLPRIPV